eukprot:8110399-Alexandrium_andersonii.AAC.1
MLVPGAAVNRSVDLALLTAAPKDLDPVTVFWLQRICAFRRYVAIEPEADEALGERWSILKGRGHPGCAGTVSYTHLRAHETSAHL